MVKIRFDGLTVRYGADAALKGVSLDVHANEILGIIGPAGSGKTSLLRALCRQLQAQGHPTVVFDAWKYESSGPLLPALLRQVWEATPDGYKTKAKARATFRELMSYAWRVAKRAAPAIATAVAAGAGGADATTSAVAASATSKMIGEVEKAAAAESDELGAANVAPAEDPTDALWTRFEALVRDAWSKPEHPLRGPVIFVDDLDRCSPLGAVELLDDLRVLVNRGQSTGCRFVVAMDRGMLAHAIAAKFTLIADYDGNRYLEKIFPIAFTLPVPQGRDVARLVNSFLTPAAGASPDQQDALSQALSEPMFANPRLMKRCINRFRLVQFFEGGRTSPRDPSEAATRDRLLARWIVATDRWPTLRVLLPQHGEEFWREVERAATTPDGVFPSGEVKRLIEEQGALPWLRREVFAGGSVRLAQLREAEGRLRRWGL